MENSFNKLLREYPGALDNRKMFGNLVKDYFPKNLLQANLIMALYDMKIHEDLRTARNIGNTFAFRYVKRLMDEHGTSRKNADQAVALWCVCYGKNTLKKPCEIAIVDYAATSRPAIQENKPKTGSYSDLFSYEKIGEDYAVTGFNGENQSTVVFQNRVGNDKVVRIASNSFEETLTREAIITDGYREIGSCAFRACPELSQVILPGTIREIGGHAFEGCKKLTTIALPNGLQQIGKAAFSGTSLRTVSFPGSLYWVDDAAFANCSNLAGVVIPATINRISDRCYMNCTSLAKVSIAEGIESIGKEAFANCTALLTITIPDSVTSIGEAAFADMNPRFIVHCSMGSYAETYARNNKLKYQLI